MTREGYVIWPRAMRAALLPNTEAEARNCRQKREVLIDGAVRFAKVSLDD